MHGWKPKLAFRYFNMNLNNAYKIYRALVTLHTPGRRFLSMGDSIELATDVFLQRGDAMRKQKPEHPNAVRDLSQGVFNTGSGRKICQIRRAIILRLEIHGISWWFRLISDVCARSKS